MNLENSLAYDNFINDLEKDVMPFVEKTFSVSTGTENTAIAGFSMGGREALYIGIQHPEQFGYVGAVCPAPGLVSGTDTSQHPGQLKDDELKFDKTMDLHICYVWQLLDGTGHDESRVEIYLYNYMQMIFK